MARKKWSDLTDAEKIKMLNAYGKNTSVQSVIDRYEKGRVNEEQTERERLIRENLEEDAKAEAKRNKELQEMKKAATQASDRYRVSASNANRLASRQYNEAMYAALEGNDATLDKLNKDNPSLGITKDVSKKQRRNPSFMRGAARLSQIFGNQTETAKGGDFYNDLDNNSSYDSRPYNGLSAEDAQKKREEDTERFKEIGRKRALERARAEGYTIDEEDDNIDSILDKHRDRQLTNANNKASQTFAATLDKFKNTKEQQDENYYFNLIKRYNDEAALEKEKDFLGEDYTRDKDYINGFTDTRNSNKSNKNSNREQSTYNKSNSTKNNNNNNNNSDENLSTAELYKKKTGKSWANVKNDPAFRDLYNGSAANNLKIRERLLKGDYSTPSTNSAPTPQPAADTTPDQSNVQNNPARQEGFVKNTPNISEQERDILLYQLYKNVTGRNWKDIASDEKYGKNYDKSLKGNLAIRQQLLQDLNNSRNKK